MSIQAVVWAINARVGDPILKVLLMTLANYANTDNQTWHKQDKISFDTEIPVRSLRRRMHELVELGLISVEERRREDGTKSSQMITVLMNQAATVADGTSGQKEGSPAANKVAGHRIVKNRNEEYTYGEEFETLWQLYPRTKNTSKKKAHDIWRMLNNENRARVTAAVPIFAAAMRAEGRPEDKIAHMTSWLNGRMYETAAAPASAPAAKQAAADWHKTATREQWAKILLIWSGTNDWRASWGPSPDQPGCSVPADMIAEHNLKHRGFMFSEEQLETFRSQVRVPRNAAQAAE